MKLNWRQILIHFLAAFSLMLSFNILAFLINVPLFEKTIYKNSDTSIDPNLMQTDVLSFAYKTAIIGTVGLIVAFIISLVISLKNKWGWINSVLILITIYVIGFLGIRGEMIKGFTFSIFNKISSNISLVLFASGLILFLFSLILFFSKTLKRFIIK